MSSITIRLTPDQRLLLKYILEEHAREHEVNNEQFDDINDIYKKLVSYATLSN